MSTNAGTSGPADGVVRNSALSFIAPAQVSFQPTNAVPDDLTERQVPLGLKALCDACSKLYPDQPNPLQVTTRLKYWLGGQDPLDYISMYWNPGIPEDHVPPHWHYISLGVSDLHGDGRVHPLPGGGASGYGLELSLRLASPPKTSGPAGATEAPSTPAPPLWPAALLQATARYIFATGNKFCAGDHISWHAPLDGSPRCRLRHLLVAADKGFTTIHTPHGTVEMLQLVGCTTRELRAAQRGSGFDILKVMQQDPSSGGVYLVTDVSRRRSVRAPRAPGAAHLAGVTARLAWQPITTPHPTDPGSPQITPSVEQQIKDTLQRGLTSMSTDRTGPEGHMSTDSFEMSSIERALPHVPDLMQGSWRQDPDETEYLSGVHLFFNAEGASLLPLAINGRVLHDRHFTWRYVGRAITVLSEHVGGALVTTSRPYARKGNWLQVLIPQELAEDMSKQVANLSKLADTDSESDEEKTELTTPPIPTTLYWEKHSLKISVLPDHEFL